MTYRTREEVTERRKQDPVPAFEAVLVEHGVMSPEDVAAMRKDVLRETNEATDAAEALPYPQAERPLHARLRRSLAAVAVVSSANSTVMNNVEAVRATLYEALKNDERTLIHRRGRRRARQRLPDHQGFRRASSASGASSTRRSPKPRSSASRSAWRWKGCARSPRSSSPTSSIRRSTRSSARRPRSRYRSNGEYTCPLVIRTPYGGGVRGALSHSVSIEALFYHVPGFKIVAPSFPADVKGLLNAAIDDPDPVLFLEHKKTYRLIKGEVPERPLYDSDRQGQRLERRHAAHRRLVRPLRALGARSRAAARGKTACRSR